MDKDMPDPEQRDKKWGRIFMGTRISELNDVENVRSRAWDAKDESEYLERVKAKAVEKARAILANAEAEAAEMRRRAREEGYAEGLEQARAELEEARAAMSGAVSGVLEAVQEESIALTRAWREDLAALVPLAVEKALALTLSQERRAVLESLYTQALRALESSRRITVRVNPEDEAAIADIIEQGGRDAPQRNGPENWKVKGDPAVTPGGLYLESESSLADNSIESRQAAVAAVLAGLTVPDPDGETKAAARAAEKEELIAQMEAAQAAKPAAAPENPPAAPEGGEVDEQRSLV
ncbi:MAG: flagellar assembly protein FliH [Deltaproteobacteria bacterium]|jgi:flagellar assembly protein FliH|nr:flagellar assembly protein FliH [Deltaproteobacteria bacterium]